MFGVVTITDYHSSILRDIELVELNDSRIMLVLATDNGLVKSMVLDLDINIAINIDLLNRMKPLKL